jgi:hypothetical protein
MASTKVSLQQQKNEEKRYRETCSLRGREKVTNENLVSKNINEIYVSWPVPKFHCGDATTQGNGI